MNPVAAADLGRYSQEEIRRWKEGVLRRNELMLRKGICRHWKNLKSEPSPRTKPSEKVPIVSRIFELVFHYDFFIPGGLAAESHFEWKDGQMRVGSS